jgi:hypothetical protein
VLAAFLVALLMVFAATTDNDVLRLLFTIMSIIGIFGVIVLVVEESIAFRRDSDSDSD